uniref:unconventional myosin-X-like n=1 Tax=Oncorhynchus gorbuscha TaxID=8017 RepID=UPI001EAF5BB8
DSLHSLMNTLSASNPFFVRCIKPNMNKNANMFDPEVVLNQLRYSGMLETVKIRRAGFPVRRTFNDFHSRYKIILKDRHPTDDQRGRCTELLMSYDPAKIDWQLGKTKVRWSCGSDITLLHGILCCMSCDPGVYRVEQ